MAILWYVLTGSRFSTLVQLIFASAVSNATMSAASCFAVLLPILAIIDSTSSPYFLRMPTIFASSLSR